MSTVVRGTTTSVGLAKLYELLWIHLDPEKPLKDFFRSLIQMDPITDRTELEINPNLKLVLETNSFDTSIWDFQVTIGEIPTSGNMSLGQLPELLADAADFGVIVTAEPPAASE